MRERILRLLGLMRRANAIAVGETNTGACAKTGQAALLLLAADASDNARRRAEGFAAGRSLTLVTLPFEKTEIAAALGLSGGSMAAIKDAGFAEALLKALAEWEPERYGEMAADMEKRRRGQAQRQMQNKRIGKRRTNG